MNKNQFFNWSEYNKTSTHPRKKYSLFGKVGGQWKRVSAITCRNKREAEIFFRKTLALELGAEVRPVS